jgi:chemotaxis protein CheD
MVASAYLAEHFLYPGTIYAEKKPGRVQTILGSCVSVCLFDQSTGIGGINHFMLPWWTGSGLQSPKYGDVAIARLIEKMISLGCQRKHFVAKIFGGADQHQLGHDGFHVGMRNILASEKILQEEQIQVIARSTGGAAGRKLIYNTHSNQVFIKFLQVNITP